MKKTELLQKLNRQGAVFAKGVFNNCGGEV
jgi:hypothetical protein